MGLNTVRMPVSQKLVEPKEGKYDSALADGLQAKARVEQLHIAFLRLAA